MVIVDPALSSSVWSQAHQRINVKVDLIIRYVIGYVRVVVNRNPEELLEDVLVGQTAMPPLRLVSWVVCSLKLSLRSQVMEVRLPAEKVAIVEGMVASGRFATVDEAIAEGIRLLASNERLRQQIQEGVDQADRGDVIDHDTLFAELREMANITQADGEK